MATLDSRPVVFLPTREAAISAAIGLAGALCIWISCVAVFRLFFHPLSSHPGPLLGRLTSLYNTFHILKKDEARNFYHLHERYGPVVRYGPNHISIRTTEAVKKLYTNSTSAKKAPSYLAFPRDPANATLFSTTNKQVHAWKRRVMRRGFSDSALRGAEVVVKKHVSMLLRCLELLGDDDGEGRTIESSKSPSTDLSARGGWGTPKNYSTWINRYSFDLSSDLSVSEPFEMMRKSENRYIIDLIHENMWAENVTGSAMTLLHEWGLKRTLLGRWVRPFKPFDDFVDHAAEARVTEKENGTDLERKDFIRWLTADDADSKTGRAITMDELKEEVILLITAGGDTSSTAISAMLYYLLHNPLKLAKLQAEVRSAFATVEDIRFGSELHSCTYLRACIDEALRMAPPAGSVLRREIEPEGVQIHDFHYPGGTNIGVPVFAIQHDPAYFPDPFSYQPERWIAGKKMKNGTLVTPESVRRASGAFVSFSAGARSCIGRPLAYMSIQILYATMMHKYDVRLCPERWINGTQSGQGPDYTDEYELKDIFTSWKSGPLVELRARV